MTTLEVAAGLPVASTPSGQRSLTEALLDLESTRSPHRRSRSTHLDRRREPDMHHLGEADRGYGGVRHMPPPLATNISDPSRKVPKAVQKLIVEESRIFRTSLDKFAAANTNLIRLNEQHNHFVEDKDGYPNGMRPFKANLGNDQMDDHFSLSKDAPYTFTLLVPAGSSRRFVGEQLHRLFIRYWKAIEVEAANASVEALQKEIRPEVLLDAVLAKHRSSKKPDIAESLGCENPYRDEHLDEELIVHACNLQYRRLYANFERSLRQKAQQSDDARAVSDAKNDEVKKTDPEDLFSVAVKSACQAEVSNQLRELGLTFADVPMEAVSSASASASNFVQSISLSKNEASPQAEAGQNKYSAPRSKATAKSRPGGRCSAPSGKRQGRRGPRTEM